MLVVEQRGEPATWFAGDEVPYVSTTMELLWMRSDPVMPASLWVTREDNSRQPPRYNTRLHYLVTPSVWAWLAGKIAAYDKQYYQAMQADQVSDEQQAAAEKMAEAFYGLRAWLHDHASDGWKAEVKQARPMLPGEPCPMEAITR